MIKGVGVTEYNNNKQYSFRNGVQFRIMKQNNLRKYIKDIDSISFTHMGAGAKNKKASFYNFYDLNNSNEEGTVWSEVICHFSGISSTSKNYYLSCPNCKKKVDEEEKANCPKCNAFYNEGKYRYILNLNLIDYTDSLWATAYDEVAEIMLAL